MTGVVEGHVIDLWVENHGTIYLIRPYTPLAEQWLDEHLQDGPRLGNARAVEHRCIQDIVNGALDDGLRIGGS